MQEVLEKLDWHEKASQARYESLSDKLKGYGMDKVENIFKTPMGGMMGDGIFGGMGGGGQIARATNSNLIVGNTGPTATGPQNANPVNVHA